MNNKLRLSFLFVAILCLFTTSVFAQFSKSDATNLVLNTILVNDIGGVDVYVSKSSGNGNITLIDGEIITSTYTNNWIFFVNDDPWASWYHDCRYIFVNSTNGNYTIINKTIYPQGLSSEYDLISEAVGNQQVDLGAATGTIISSIPPNDHYFAVLVAVEDELANWNDLSLIYNTLIDVYGYKKENIYVHYGQNANSALPNGGDLDGDEIEDDIDYSAFATAIHATFNEMAGITNLNNDIHALDEDDQLTFIVVDAPVSVEPVLQTSWHFWEYDQGGTIQYSEEDPEDIAQILDQIECAQMSLTFSLSYGLGIMNAFKNSSGLAECGSRHINVSTFYESKRYEQWITGGKYGEFFYYWCAAVRGVYPLTDYPWIESEYETGTFPFTTITGLGSHEGDFDPDEDDDGYIQMVEAFEYADALNTWSDDGYVYIPWIQGVSETNGRYFSIPFYADVLTLAGYAGHIITPVEVQGNFVIGGVFTFEEFGLGQGVDFDDGSNIFLVNQNSKIVVEEDSKIEFGYNVKVAGASNSNKIEVYGRFFTPLDNVIFTSIDQGNWKGLEMHNPSGVSGRVTIYSGSFKDCFISGTMGVLDIEEISFENGGVNANVYQSSGIEDCDFTESFIRIINHGSSTTNLNVKDCEMDGNGIPREAVYFSSFDNFEIKNNIISDYTDGIKLYYSGLGTSANILQQNQISDCSGTGMFVYNSECDIDLNHSEENGYGVKLFDRSSITLTGWNGASLPAETQRIRDCDYNEVYASQGSFPYEFEWNAIEDDLDSDPLVKSTDLFSSGYDVRNNWWGDPAYFDPTEDFEPYTSYTYLPVWVLGSGGGLGTNPAKTLYTEASNNVADSNYIDASEQFLNIVELYPNSDYARAALSDLYSIESVNNNDYNSLKTYYNTNQKIQNNVRLKKRAEFLVNFCDIKLENWPAVISWFENVIQNPESMEDSIFAIIDLGYTYFLMEQTGLKSTNTGTMVEHIPASEKEYVEKRDYLLSLLPGELEDDDQLAGVANLKEGELMQNMPNPFKGSTNITYKLDNESTVELNVYNSTGQLIRKIREGTKFKGTHNIHFDATGLNNGIYYYSISINGQVTDSRKMTIIK
jgi:hypothetical protein